MKHIITTDMGFGYKFDQVIEKEIDYGPKWAEKDCFDGLEFGNRHYYYFSNCDGSEGGYYDPVSNELVTAGELDDMEPEEREDIENNWDFVDEPICWEVCGLHVEYRSPDCHLYVIKDEDGYDYGAFPGIYQYFYGLFYPVEIDEV